ncbi:MAG: ATP-binding protein [Synergistaceae bacterium]|nr:ATP-binding protein [Synergistaceae bacterium]
MAINLKSTKGVTSNGVKTLVYGQAGVGKTTLIRTLPSPVILSAEGGLLSLQDSDIPYIPVSSISELGEVYEWLLRSEESHKFKSIALDSISEIAEVVLSEEKKNSKDARAAYGSMNDRMAQLIRAFRDLPGRHVYFSAKIEKSTTDTDALLFAPSMPGKSLTQSLPYFFDEVLALRLIQDEEGNVRRTLQCRGDLTWQAKDRSGRLSAYEPADLGAIIAKIAGEHDGD